MGMRWSATARWQRHGEVATAMAQRGACHGIEAEHDVEVRATQLDGDGLGFGAVVVGWSKGGQGPLRLRSRAGATAEGKRSGAGTWGLLVLTEVEADGGDKAVFSPLPCVCAIARMGQGTGLVQGRAVMCMRLLASGHEAAMRGRGGQLATCTALRREAMFHGTKSKDAGRSWWSGEGEHGGRGVSGAHRGAWGGKIAAQRQGEAVTGRGRVGRATMLL